MHWFLACGAAFYKTCEKLLPQLNAEGQKIVQGYFKGIIDLRERAQAGDIPGLMTNIGGTGEPGLKKLIHIVPEPLRPILAKFIKDCDNVMTRLHQNKADEREAGLISCALLSKNSKKIDNAMA